MTKYRTPGPDSTGSVGLPRVADSAAWLAEWVLERPVSDEAEAAAASVSEFLRALVEQAGQPCPDFCQVDHGAATVGERGLCWRSHETSFPPIQSGTSGRRVASVTVAAGDDLDTGRREAPVVLVEAKDALTADQAIRLADQLRAAARIVRGDSRAARTDCPPWCVRDHDADDQVVDDGSRLHDSPVKTIHGFRDGVFTDRLFRADLRIESLTTDDGSWEELPMVTLAITPVNRPAVDPHAADGLPAEMIRHMANRLLSGTECGEDVALPPAVAVALGRALIEYGEMAERA